MWKRQRTLMRNEEDAMELLLFFSGVMTFIVVTPALYITTEIVYVPLIGIAIGVANLFASQYIPDKMEFEGESEKNEQP